MAEESPLPPPGGKTIEDIISGLSGYQFAVPIPNLGGIAMPASTPESRAGTSFKMLQQWWHDRAEAEVDAVVPKAVEYGADDLTEMGQVMARMAGREVEAAEAAELGVYYYALGKMARWTAAVVDGRPVSDDTLHDLGVYIRMVQRIREVGAWPGV